MVIESKQTHFIFTFRQNLANVKKEEERLKRSLSTLQGRYDQTRAEIGNNLGLKRQLSEGLERMEIIQAKVVFRRNTLLKLIAAQRKHNKIMRKVG